MKNTAIYLLLFFLSAGIFGACNDDENGAEPENEQDQNQEYTADDSLKAFIYNVMEHSKWYYWYDEMPKLEPDSFDTANDYFQALLYKEKDHWSFITDLESFNQHYQEGKYVGLGIRMKFDAEANLRVAFAYEDSPMGKAGVTRGYKILSINGTSAEEIYNNGMSGVLKETGNDFVLENLEGEEESLTVGMQEISESAILVDSVYERSDSKIGYFMFQNFTEPANPALEKTFSAFKEKGVTDLVIDLRYNGGGMLKIASQIADLVAGTHASGTLFYKNIHNQHHSEADAEYPLYFEERANSLDIGSVVFITTDASASASEAVINGLNINALKDVVDVKVVGSATHGKPVGMYPFYSDENELSIGKVVAPVTFKGVNADNYGDYFGGIPADAQRLDDLAHRFGNTDEMCLQEALYYIENGAFSQPVKAVHIPKRRIRLKGFQREIGAF